jgi:hypothetical protein
MYQVVLSAFICWQIIKSPHLSASNAGPFNFTCKHAQHPAREVVWWMLHRPHPRHDQLGPTGPPLVAVFCGWCGTFSDCWNVLKSDITSSFSCWIWGYSNRCFFRAAVSSLVAISCGGLVWVELCRTVAIHFYGLSSGTIPYGTTVPRWLQQLKEHA